MLRIQYYAELTRPKQVEARRVVILDCFGNPLALAMEDAPQTYVYSGLGSPDFEMLLKSMGVTRTVISTEAQTKPLSDVIWTP